MIVIAPCKPVSVGRTDDMIEETPSLEIESALASFVERSLSRDSISLD